MSQTIKEPLTVTYINDHFGDAAKAFYHKHNTKLPVLGQAYTIRRVVLNKYGDYCLLLNEIKNHPYGDSVEPPFHYSRFTNIRHNVLEWELVDKIYKAQKPEKPL